MTGRNIISIVVFLTFIGPLFGQDKTIYRQENARMFFNHYKFVKKNKSDKFGYFIQYCGTDDNQNWYGLGIFTETNKKYFLTFDITNTDSRIEVDSSTGHSDTLYIKWFDWVGEQQKSFSVRSADTIINKSIYYSDLITGFVKVPKKDLTNKSLSLYVMRTNRKVYDFLVTDNIDEINIFVEDKVFL